MQSIPCTSGVLEAVDNHANDITGRINGSVKSNGLGEKKKPKTFNGILIIVNVGVFFVLHDDLVAQLLSFSLNLFLK